MGKIQYIFFDAANTLIHKPLLWRKISNILKKHGNEIPEKLLKHNHKLISENFHFPDRTSSDFYRNFNSELLYSVGIIPTSDLLEEIFLSCSYLPWEKFDDTSVLYSLSLPIGVISNFNKTLDQTLKNLFDLNFQNIIISENYGVGKPNPEFYDFALREIGIDSSKVLYVGDSLKLDIEPALELGMNAILIDRNDDYPFYKNRILNMNQLIQYL